MKLNEKYVNTNLFIIQRKVPKKNEYTSMISNNFGKVICSLPFLHNGETYKSDGRNLMNFLTLHLISFDSLEEKINFFKEVSPYTNNFGLSRLLYTLQKAGIHAEATQTTKGVYQTYTFKIIGLIDKQQLEEDRLEQERLNEEFANNWKNKGIIQWLYNKIKEAVIF